MLRRLGHAISLPLRVADSILRRVFGEPLADESLNLRNAAERAEELRRQVDRSHR
jgi:hypothetical protein